MNKLVRYCIDPLYRFSVNRGRGLYDGLSDIAFLKKRYRVECGHNLDLSNPTTFTEKLQWLKLYDRRPEYHVMVDKIEAKAYVSGIIGEEHIIRTLAVWDSVNDIDISILPRSFVLKCSHDSGGVVICHDRDSFDFKSAKQRLRECFERDFYLLGREWPYKNLNRRIFAEELLADDSDKEERIAGTEDAEKTDLKDYKVYCFNGEPKFCQIISDRSTMEKIDFFDMDGTLAPFTGLHKKRAPFPHNDSVGVPPQYDELKQYARLLSTGIPFARIDFFVVANKVYFGEITLYPASGFGYFEPCEYDAVLGSLIQLESVKS